MSVENIVGKTKIPENLKRFSNWNGGKEYNNASFCTTGCGSFCSGGACTVAYTNISYFGKEKVETYKK